MSEFLPSPGPRERHLIRKSENPLFRQTFTLNPEEIEAAREQDRIEFDALLRDVNQALERAAALDARAEADDILALKAEMERLYTRVCSTGGDTDKIKEALRKLIGLMSNALVNAAGNDQEALSRINEDMESTELHLQISEQPLAADILHEPAIIPAEDLPATLLGESEEAVSAALLLFSPDQIEEILASIDTILKGQSKLLEDNPGLLERHDQIRKWHDNIGL